MNGPQDPADSGYSYVTTLTCSALTLVQNMIIDSRPDFGTLFPDLSFFLGHWIIVAPYCHEIHPHFPA